MRFKLDEKYMKVANAIERGMLLLSLSLILLINVFAQSDKRSSKPSNIKKSTISNVNRNSSVTTFAKILDEIVPGLLKKYNAPGLAAGVLEKGKISFTKGYGLANVANNQPMTADIILNVASVSKPVTAWAIMRLVEKGKFSLDSPIDSLLKDWRLPASEFDNNQVTVRRLLSHTGGTNVLAAPWFGNEERTPTLIEVLNGSAGDKGAVRVVKKPGSVWSYSGGGFTILELLLEETVKQPFNQYLTENLFKPLKMKNTSFITPDPRKNPQAATLYDENGKVVSPVHVVGESAGNLHTTVNDFTRLLKAYYQIYHGKSKQKILSQNSLKTMLTKEADVDLKEVGLDLMDTFYGLGHGIHKTKSGELVVYHSGGNPGVRAYFFVSPESGNGMILISNSDNGVEVMKEILHRWEQYFQVNLQTVY